MKLKISDDVTKTIPNIKESDYNKFVIISISVTGAISIVTRSIEGMKTYYRLLGTVNRRTYSDNLVIWPNDFNKSETLIGLMINETIHCTKNGRTQPTYYLINDRCSLETFIKSHKLPGKFSGALTHRLQEIIGET